jgi:GTPase
MRDEEERWDEAGLTEDGPEGPGEVGWMEGESEGPGEVGWTEAELDLRSLEEDLLPEGHRSGFVAVVGRPNVGKSTLMNAYLGQKVAIVSAKPQTTRLRQLGILTAPDYQIVFVDTPGWHVPEHKLGEYMVQTAARAMDDADVILFVADVSELPQDEDRRLARFVVERRGGVPVALALNKVDLLKQEGVGEHSDGFRTLLPMADRILVSARDGYQLDKLLAMIVEGLPEGPRYYPEDQVTDIQVRALAAELIREQALHLLRQEVPHAVAVVVDEFKERTEGLVYVSATIYVEKESQKGILIGRGGTMLKKLGAEARGEMERALETRVYLDLWVKVRHNWRKKVDELRRLGYNFS